MKKITLLFTAIIFWVNGFSQNIIMPVTGSQTIATCCDKFYDSGDSLLNYSNNENGQITFLPATPVYFITITFTFFSVADTGDILSIYNGNSTSGPLLGTFSIGGMPACYTLTSTDTATRGLTITFLSDGAGTSGGWRARVSCVIGAFDAYPHGIDCANPYYLGFQLSATCQTTECFGNDYTPSTPGVCSSNFSSGEDKVYYIQAQVSGNFEVVVSNINTPNCGLFLYSGMCPPATGNCVRMDTTILDGGLCVTIPFVVGTQIYIVVDTWAPPTFVDYDINVNYFGICLFVGVDDTGQTGSNFVSLFPNPATTSFTIYDLRFTILEIEIYNTLGKKAYSQQETNNQQPITVDVSQLFPGVYFVAVTDDKGNKITRRFIKM